MKEEGRERGVQGAYKRRGWKETERLAEYSKILLIIHKTLENYLTLKLLTESN